LPEKLILGKLIPLGYICAVKEYTSLKIFDDLSNDESRGMR